MSEAATTTSEPQPQTCHYCGTSSTEGDGGGTLRTRDGSAPEVVRRLCSTCFNAVRAWDYATERKITTGLYHDACFEESCQPFARRPVRPWLVAIAKEMKPTEAAAREWEREVWFGGHHPEQDDERTVEDKRGKRVYRTNERDKILTTTFPPGSLQRLYDGFGSAVKCVHDGVTYSLMSTMCRVVVQIETEKTRVVIRLTEDYARPTACFYGGEGKVEDFEPLIRQAIEAWKAGALKFEPRDTLRVV